MRITKKVLLFTAGVPRHEDHMAEALPSIYVIAASVLMVAFFVAIGSGLMASRSVPDGWPEIIRWPLIVSISLILGAFIFFVDHALIVAGAGVTSRFKSLVLLIIRIGFVIIFSANFALETAFWQHEESLNLTKLSMEQTQLNKDRDNISKLYDLPSLRETANNASTAISELMEKQRILPVDIEKKFSMAKKASEEASVLWRRWMNVKDADNEDKHILEGIRQQAIKKGNDARRIQNMAERERTEYLHQLQVQIDDQTRVLHGTRQKLSENEIKATRMVEPRSETIKRNYRSRSVNRVALEQLRKENPGIDIDILIKFLLFTFVELMPITLKLIIGSGNPIYLKINQDMIRESNYYRSVIWIDQARLKATHDVLRTQEMRNSMKEQAFMQINARLPFFRFSDVLEDGTRQASRVSSQKGVSPDLYEMFFGAANEAYEEAAGNGRGIHKKAERSQNRKRAFETFQ